MHEDTSRNIPHSRRHVILKSCFILSNNIVNCSRAEISFDTYIFLNSARKLRVEVLTTMVMKSSFFCDTRPCSPVKVNRHFGRIRVYILHLQG